MKIMFTESIMPIPIIFPFGKTMYNPLDLGFFFTLSCVVHAGAGLVPRLCLDFAVSLYIRRLLFARALHSTPICSKYSVENVKKIIRVVLFVYLKLE